jgi:hypothetical protein
LKLFEKISDWLSNILLPMSNETIKVVVLCIVTATTFWFFNALNDNYTTRISYPIEFNYPDSAMVVVEELPDNVKINVSGGGWNLLRKTFWFTIDPVVIELEDPANEKFVLGSTLYPTISDQMTEIQLNFIETDTLWVAIDSLKQQKSVLKFDSAAVKLASNFRITSSISLSTDTAIFTGPKRFVDSIPSEIILKTKKDAIDSDFKEDIMLSTFGSSLVRRNPVEVEVRFQVARFINQELMLPFKMINVPTDSFNYKMIDSLATLKFQIREELANQYNLDSFSIVVDYELMSPNDSTVIPILESSPNMLKATDIKLDTLNYNYSKN